MLNRPKNNTIYLSFDVEEWFQTENLREVFPINIWDKCEFRIKNNTYEILELLNRYDIKATFFILGWIAKRYPGLVNEIYAAGHEIASHGYGHVISYKLSKEQLFNDIRSSKEVLENIIGNKIIGYRAPNFSITDLIIDILIENGFIYDSSYHPFSMNKRYGNIEEASYSPFIIKNNFVEIPLSIWQTKYFDLAIAGGGYFRLYPYCFYNMLVKSYFKRNEHLILYFHPWEFDPEQPRVRMRSKWHKLRHYIGLKKTLWKLDVFIRTYLGLGYRFAKLEEIALKLIKCSKNE